MKRSCESDLASANGGVRRIRFGCSTRAASMCVKQACSRTIQTSSAACFLRGSASPSMRERRVNGVYDASCTGQVASSAGRWYWFSLKNTPKALANFGPGERQRIYNRTLKPACSKWWSLVKASVSLRSCIITKLMQSMTPQSLSNRLLYNSQPFV